jgi:hypothetical protein
LLSCLCQYILLKAVEKEVPALEDEVIGFADKVINQLNNASSQWSDGVNNIINDTNTKINDDVFGWVNITTGAVNDTLNAFVNETMKVLNETFGGTPLYTPVVDVLNCLVLLKVKGIEDGLTWVSDHAHIDFPLLPNDTFSLGTIQKVSGSEADILNTGPNGTAANEIADAVYHVTNMLAKTIRQEAIISTCMLLIWVVIALIGLCRAGFLMFKGGDDGTYQAHPNDAFGTFRESHEMDEFGLPRVPTYEQATRHSTFEPGNNSGDKYNGQSYTLTPHPLPNLEVHDAASPIMRTGFSPPPESAEKLGNVNGSNVDAAIRRPTHIRASSHGDYGLTSPTSPFPPPLPSRPAANTGTQYLRPIADEKQNPFADPPR